MHLAFQAEDEAAVRRFHDAGLAAGGTDNGRPGERSYHPGYYAAYVLDPDGYNVEAVFHGPLARSAASVVLTPSSCPEARWARSGPAGAETRTPGAASRRPRAFSSPADAPPQTSYPSACRASLSFSLLCGTFL